MLYGAIIGDMLGSVFEFDPWRLGPDALDFFPPGAHPTDDSVLTCAVAEALLVSRKDSRAVNPEIFSERIAPALRRWGEKYPGAGYGGRFMRWLLSDRPAPYGSLGNGSAMRVSPCAWAAHSPDEALDLARRSALPTHNHPQGVAGAQAAVWLHFACADRDASGRCRNEEAIRNAWNARWQSLLGPIPELAELEAQAPIRNELSCAGTLPVAAALVLGCRSYEETVRRAVALGGDCDTIAAIAGAAAEAAFGIPDALIAKANALLPADMRNVIAEFEACFGA